MQLVKTSYSPNDVTVLLKDISGQVEILGTEEREQRNQAGTHYSEMIPLEYTPSNEYLSIYSMALTELAQKTAQAIATVSEKIYTLKGSDVVIVSLARAGTPIGILVKRYLKLKYGIDPYHYSVSIIRGKGLDQNAMGYITERHSARNVQFLDGWVGKGAITRVLEDTCHKLMCDDPKCYEGLSAELAVVSDPAWTTPLCGTHEDFLIPNACLNSTVSGLFSRTYHKEGIIAPHEYHGAVYYDNLKQEDKSIEFLAAVSHHFKTLIKSQNDLDTSIETKHGRTGLDEVKGIADHFGIEDINKIKPGVGETTRVLLRRVPWCVLVKDKATTPPHILNLCQNKGIEVKEYPLEMYSVCGIIKSLSADL